MEEILASIRRIIADEDSISASRRERIEPQIAPIAQQNEVPAPAPAAAEPAPEEFDLDEPAFEAYEATETYALDTPLPDDAAPIEQTDESGLEPALADYEPEQISEEPGDYYLHDEAPAPLVSPDAAASVTAQFQTLAASMLINDSGLLHDYARELLRPMLKAWLDDNLPVLVERLVRAEIERVARGGRR
ncbi:PopZ family protein [Methylocystis heyeri]|nr:DUF2497 domain-containing protein [Methylocystis heyeri]